MNFDKIQGYRILYHLLFWLLFDMLLASLLAVIKADIPIHLWVLKSTIMTIAYCVPTYVVLLFIIPELIIKRRKVFLAILFSVVVAALGSPIVSAASYFNYNEYNWYMDDFSHLHLILTSFVNIVFIIILTGGIKLAKHWFHKTQQQSQRIKELEIQSLSTELKFLKAQINPHFLFNTLNNLYSLTLQKDEQAPDVVLKLSEMMRYLLYECNEKFVPLEKEIAFIQNYIDLETIRKGEETNVQLKVNGLLYMYDIKPMLLVPFLENSFKHGINNHIGDGWINVDISVDDDLLNFTVQNSLPPKNGGTKAKHGGIGLANVKRRLELAYPEKHSLEIDSDDNQFNINLSLALNKKEL